MRTMSTERAVAAASENARFLAENAQQREERITSSTPTSVPHLGKLAANTPEVLSLPPMLPPSPPWFPSNGQDQDADPLLGHEPTNHSEWQHCFDAIGSRTAYASALYGTSAAAAEDAFRWTHVNVIYPSLIPHLNVTCFNAADMVYRRAVVGAIFVDYPERSKIMSGNKVNLGGPRAPPKWRRWPWTEVLHSPSWGRGMVDEQLWMYIARGSGLWFNPGRVLELSDTSDLAIFLNASYSARHTGSKAVLMQLGVCAPSPRDARLAMPASQTHDDAQWLFFSPLTSTLAAVKRLSHQFDSVAFAYHVDGGCCHRMVMRELISLHNFSKTCPVSPSMARGWPPHNLRPCNCTPRVGVC